MIPGDLDPLLLEASELVRNKMNKTLLEIAQENAEDYKWDDVFPDTAAIITLLDIALCPSQPWDVVIATLHEFDETFPGTTLTTFPDIVKADNKRRFVEKWFFQDLKRFTIIEKLVARFVKYKEDWVLDTEFEAMQHWAKKYHSSKGWPDPKTDQLLQGVVGLDIVDAQYLIMRLGARTVKPDNRLKLVFNHLEVPVQDELDLIRKSHKLAEQLGIDPLVLDQMFW